MTTLTLRYVDLIQTNIQCLKGSKRHEKALKRQTMTWTKVPSSKRQSSMGYHKHMSKDGHTLGGGELLAYFCT